MRYNASMNASKKLFVAAALLLAASMFSIGALVKEKPAAAPENGAGRFILYYGSTCPHCKIVENYLQKNDPENKLDIRQKEVSQNQENRDEFVAKAKDCALNVSQLGVPMLWDADSQKCYVGDQPIIDFLGRLILSNSVN